MIDQPGEIFFTLLMPAYETPPTLLARAVRSVIEQTYQLWELVVVDDGSPTVDVSGIVDQVASEDNRVRTIRRPVNGGIVAASNDGLRAARGAFVALMDHDDLLEHQALELCASVIQEYPDCDLLYTDEDWIDMDDVQLGPFLKPDWSPERLRAQNYVNHLAVYRRSMVNDLGAFRTGYDGSQDYDLVLRVSERARRIVHVPRVLYHWRVRPGQVSGTGDPAVYRAAREAIEEHCSRLGERVRVEQIDPLGIYRVHRTVQGNPLVSVVIPTRGATGTVWGSPRVFVLEAVRTIVGRSSYPNINFVIVADRAMPDDTAAELLDACDGRLRILWYDRQFNFSYKVNLGVAAADGEYVLLLNDDVEVISCDWIETMLGLAQQPDVGMVGAALFFEDGTFQHAGHLYLGGSAIGHIGYGIEADHPGPVAALKMERECSGVTAACALLRRDDYLAVGGLSRCLPVNFNDVDLSLKIRSMGRRIVWTPFAKLYHFESKSREIGVGITELDVVRRRWGRVLDQGDPFWRHPDQAWIVADPSAAFLEAQAVAEGTPQPRLRVPEPIPRE